jgi:hypothetical protein
VSLSTVYFSVKHDYVRFNTDVISMACFPLESEWGDIAWKIGNGVRFYHNGKCWVKVTSRVVIDSPRVVTGRVDLATDLEVEKLNSQ